MSKDYLDCGFDSQNDNTIDPEGDAGPFNEAQDTQVCLINARDLIHPVASDTPGMCIECGKKITKTRIRALGPTVARCIDCQKEIEKT